MSDQGYAYTVDEQGRPVVPDADLMKMDERDLKALFAYAKAVHETRNS